MAEHCGALPTVLFYPPADDCIKDWLKDFPNVQLETRSLSQRGGWNIKPDALLDLLNRGHQDVLWVDSDIIVTRDFLDFFDHLEPETLVATEEALWGSYLDSDARRARAWGFEVGRNLPFTVNTAVLRTTPAHIPLLERWRSLLADDVYHQAQQLKPADRPDHLFGDQDVLSALLTSAEFSHIKLKFLMRGTDILQYFGPSGYTCAERARNILRGPPRFVHSQVFKPWIKFQSSEKPYDWRTSMDLLYLDLSPYTLAAARYQHEIKQMRAWARPHSILARVLRFAGLFYPPLVGFPIAFIADVIRLADLKVAKQLYFRATAPKATRDERVCHVDERSKTT
ncbi:hypothetical protein ONR75_24765 [Rhodopseudomonas sp. P2A-2r]|uniref:hypothetical protein n=1 Tax=Rhodopseudomonas sp. P2A-2r TaxID=2991972 RepID=UPI002234BFE7|nr:hypothetical protein [Rhodopseudomonas sp. P2A-2r]UZE48034.1 hypothetical protein ONR75_24765 [Rhodopseudomonas sp. P2A-2r]